MVLAGLIASVGTGCKKSEAPPPPPVRDGVAIDAHKFQDSFPNASPELKVSVRNFGMNIRYGNYENAMDTLDKIAADPSLNEAQKKLVADTIEQVKKANENKNAAAAEPPK
jgi:hypothetical protein